MSKREENADLVSKAIVDAIKQACADPVKKMGSGVVEQAFMDMWEDRSEDTMWSVLPNSNELKKME